MQDSRATVEEAMGSLKEPEVQESWSEAVSSGLERRSPLKNSQQLWVFACDQASQPSSTEAEKAHRSQPSLRSY